MSTPYIWLCEVNVDTYGSGFGLKMMMACPVSIDEADDDGSCHVVWWGAHNFHTIDHKDRYDDGDECDGKL